MGNENAMNTLQELNRSILAMSSTINGYRIAQWDALNEQDRVDLEKSEFALLRVAGELIDNDVLARVEQIKGHLDALGKCTEGLREATKQIVDARKTIVLAGEIALSGGALALAISSGNPVAIGASVLNLLGLFTPGGQASKAAPSAAQ